MSNGLRNPDQQHEIALNDSRRQILCAERDEKKLIISLVRQEIERLQGVIRKGPHARDANPYLGMADVREWKRKREESVTEEGRGGRPGVRGTRR